MDGNIVDRIVSDNKIYAFKRELKTAIGRRQDWLKLMLSSLGCSDDMPQISKIDQLHNDFEKAALKTKWTRLTIDQKIGRIREYVERVYDGDEDTLDVLVSELKNKKLKTKDITYDTIVGIITNINE